MLVVLQAGQARIALDQATIEVEPHLTLQADHDVRGHAAQQPAAADAGGEDEAGQHSARLIVGR